MDQGISDLLAWDRVVHREQPPRKVSARESEEKQQDGKYGFPAACQFKMSDQRRLRSIIQGNDLALLASRCFADERWCAKALVPAQNCDGGFA
jgi:hypothetical protein